MTDARDLNRKTFGARRTMKADFLTWEIALSLWIAFDGKNQGVKVSAHGILLLEYYVRNGWIRSKLPELQFGSV
jgi:hypothetical protein